MGKLTGKWLPPAPQDHECRTPPLWGAKRGQRWQCQAEVEGMSNGRCDKVWQVRDDGNGKVWREEGAFTPDPGLQVLSVATDAAIEYWLAEELGDLAKTQDPGDVVRALQKHFTIGTTR